MSLRIRFVNGVGLLRPMHQTKHGTSVTGNTKDTSASCHGLNHSRLAIHMIRRLVEFETPMPFQLRRHSPMPFRFLKVIVRLLRKSLQSSMATLAMLNVVIFRSRLLSGSGRCLAPRAVEEFLVNDRELSVSIRSSIRRKETSPLVEGRVCAE